MGFRTNTQKDRQRARDSLISRFSELRKRESDGTRRFIAHVPQGTANNYALDATN